MAMTREQILTVKHASAHEVVKEICDLALSALPDRARNEAAPAAGRGEVEVKVYQVSFHPNMDYDDVVLKRDYDTLLQRLAEMTAELKNERLLKRLNERRAEQAEHRAAQAEALLAEAEKDNKLLGRSMDTLSHAARQLLLERYAALAAKEPT